MIMKRIGIIALMLSAALASSAQDKTVQKIIEMGQNDNKVMAHEEFLSNRIGGRIVGSGSLEDAEKWVAAQFRSWGLDVMIQEAGEINVGFNRGPWFGKMVGDQPMTLHFGTPSYTAGTNGPQRGHVVIEPKTRREFEANKARYKGAWVLIGGTNTGWPIDWSEAADKARAEEIAKREAAAANRSAGASAAAGTSAANSDEPSPALFYRELVDAGILGIIQSSDTPIRLLYDRKNCYDLTLDNLPTVCDIKLDKEQYDIIYRKAQNKDDFQLEFDIRNHFRMGPIKYHNIIGILKGSKYPDEYVMTGGHLDAFDGGTGSVDDGQGTAVTMETARLIALSGAKPKRSIAFCVWTAEEFGLFGSKHFVESGVVPMNKISNYFNRDGGPEVAVSVTVPEAMYDDFVSVSKPLVNLNPEFPFTVNKRTAPAGPRPTTAGGSDHAYFAMNGVPTIGLDLKDVKGYGFQYGEIWHTERDLMNRIWPEYLEHSAIVNSVIIYGLSNLDHLLSREGLYTD